MEQTPTDEKKEMTALPVRADASGKFLPGVSGNPAGKPRGTRNFATVMKTLLELPTDRIGAEFKDEYGRPISKMEAMALVQVKRAEHGDLSAFKEIADRVDGKATQSLDIIHDTERERWEREQKEIKEICDRGEVVIKEEALDDADSSD